MQLEPPARDHERSRNPRTARAAGVRPPRVSLPEPVPGPCRCSFLECGVLWRSKGRLPDRRPSHDVRRRGHRPARDHGRYNCTGTVASLARNPAAVSLRQTSAGKGRRRKRPALRTGLRSRLALAPRDGTHSQHRPPVPPCETAPGGRRRAWIIRAMAALDRFHGRRAAVIENQALRITVLEGGGHIASVLDKATGVSPLWVPPWPSIEPSAFGPAAPRRLWRRRRRPAARRHHGAQPLPRHLRRTVRRRGGGRADRARGGLGRALRASTGCRRRLIDAGRSSRSRSSRSNERSTSIDRTVRVREVVENLAGTDRPIGWTQHVTLGPPFLERGVTEFRASATRS